MIILLLEIWMIYKFSWLEGSHKGVIKRLLFIIFLGVCLNVNGFTNRWLLRDDTLEDNLDFKST